MSEQHCPFNQDDTDVWHEPVTDCFEGINASAETQRSAPLAVVDITAADFNDLFYSYRLAVERAAEEGRVVPKLGVWFEQAFAQAVDAANLNLAINCSYYMAPPQIALRQMLRTGELTLIKHVRDNLAGSGLTAEQRTELQVEVDHYASRWLGKLSTV